MDFQYTPEQETFRAEVRGWLEKNLSPDLCVEDPRDERIAPDRETFERRREWQRTMYKAGWVGIAWPKQHGGRGAGLMEQVIFDEEYTLAKAPVPPRLLRSGALRSNVGAMGNGGTKASGSCPAYSMGMTFGAKDIPNPVQGPTSQDCKPAQSRMAMSLS